MRWFILGLLLVHSLSVAQVRVHPEEVAPGQPFAIELDAVFPTPCSLEGTWTLERQGNQLIAGLQPALIACIEVLARLHQAIGPFRLDAGAVSDDETLELVVVIDPDGALPQEVGRTLLTVRNDPPDADELQPGLYWDPQLPGIGVAVSAAGDDLFLATFGFDAVGLPEWTIGQGRLEGPVLDDDLLIVSGGPCLRCGPAEVGPLIANPVSPLQLIVTGPAAAVVTTGDTARRGLLLQPFELHTVTSEGTIAGVTFEMPDLTGNWLFSDARGESAFTSDLAPVATGISDSGMAWFESADGRVRMQCGGVVDARFRCELRIDDVLFGTADSRQISSRSIRSDDLVGVRLSP